MARKPKKAPVQDLSLSPRWPTWVKKQLPGGRLVGIDNSMWMVRSVPMGAVSDARTDDMGDRVASPILNAMDRLSRLGGPIRMTRRATERGKYREVQLLLIDLPELFRADSDKDHSHDALARYQQVAYGRHSTKFRNLFMAVRLNASMGSSNIKQVVSELVDDFFYETSNEHYFADDARKVAQALSQSGLREPTEREMQLAQSWWNSGGRADPPELVHLDHLHIFGQSSQAKVVAQMIEDGKDDCSQWPPIKGMASIAFSAAKGFNLDFIDGNDPRAHWASALVGRGAAAISIRGLVEPPEVTREEVRRNRARFEADIAERAESGKMDRIEQERKLQLLTSIEDFYTQGTATLVDASMVVALTGRDENDGFDPTQIGMDCGVQLLSMDDVQSEALAETMLCSGVRANPYKLDIPSQTLAWSGLPDLARVGDDYGALLGLTQRDRQKVYVHHMAATDSDSLPLGVAVGQTGSGKLLTTRTPVPCPAGFTTVGELAVGDVIFGRDGKPCTVTHITDDQYDTTYELTLSDGQVFTAGAQHQWLVSDFRGRNDIRHPHRTTAIENHRVATERALMLSALAENTASRDVTCEELYAFLQELAPDEIEWESPASMMGALRMVDCPRRTEMDVFDLPTALRALAMRLQQMHGAEPGMAATERVMSTEEILGQGLSTSQGRARFAIRTACAIDMPTKDLPVAPYTFGVWLADGFTAPHSGTSAKNHDIQGLVKGRHSAGYLPDKRIPETYFTASIEQRLALLQGLMDNDGTISPGGNCELVLSAPDLAADCLRLVRSLGIKASATVGKAGHTNAEHQDPTRVEFTTTLPVFGMQRKAMRLPTELRESHQWLYITDIRAVEKVPMRCLTVDSPDHTYLIGDYVPTHNTMLLMSMADQWARTYNDAGERTPIMIFDPKRGSDFTPVADRTNGIVYSLDKLATANGVFDSIRFSRTAEAGVALAVSAIMSVNPWGTRDARGQWEAPLMKALNYGVSQGAKCTMQALDIAVRDGQAPKEMVDRIKAVSEADPMFTALCGSDPDSTPLRASQGITYIKVGDTELNLPSPGTSIDEADLSQRIAMTLVRSIVYAGMAAMEGRQGVLLLDEAWVFTSSGREEVIRMGRLARSMQVFPMLFTQKVSDIVDAGLTDFISRVWILPITEEKEARAACTLARLDPDNKERLASIMADATMGDEASDAGAPNWDSMRALYVPNPDKPGSRICVRGSIALHSDVKRRVANVEVILAQDLLDEISTNRVDKRERERRAQESAAAAAGANTTPGASSILDQALRPKDTPVW